MRWGRNNNTRTAEIPDKVRSRARSALAAGTPLVWVEQCLFLIGQSVTHHQKGDDALEEALQSAQALLALIEEWRAMEEAEVP